MELHTVRPNIETSGHMEEQVFSIEDQGMIFDILRNKMYSNTVLAICREISCNARDAHREVGKQDVPIEITLPTHLEPFYKIKDFGPGISPDRMVNVFIKYTASTKRKDNMQTGGFGLGAKTPFAYSDTFTILTNVDGTQYNYACFIDETRVGKLMLLATSTTSESNGTEIIIPVKPSEFKLFFDYTEISTRHWDIKPIIKGDIHFKWFEHVKILSGSNWAICKSKDNYHHTVKLIIDGIEYPVDMDALQKLSPDNLINSISGDLHLYFGVGELSLSASREQIYLDDNTKSKIYNFLRIVLDEVKTNVLLKIDAFPDFWQANVFYKKDVNQVFRDLKIFGQLKWRNLPLYSYAVNTGCNVFLFTKNNNRRGNPNKIRRIQNKSICFEENSMLFVNDLPLKEPTLRHVNKIFEENPILTSVQVVCPNDTINLNVLNSNIFFDQMAPKLLSSVAKASGRVCKPSSSRVLVFKMYKYGAFGYGSLPSFKKISYSELEKDTNVKLLVSISKEAYGSNNSRQAILSNQKSINLSALSALLFSFPNISIYGLDSSVSQSRIEEDFSDCLSLEDFILDKLNNCNINFVELKYANAYNHEINDFFIEMIPLITPLIDDPNSLMLKRAEISQKLKDLSEEKNKGLLEIYEILFGNVTDTQIMDFLKNNPEYNLKLINHQFNEKYPLYENISTYRVSRLVKEIAQYINLIDKA